jgi:hypothetical protein
MQESAPSTTHGPARTRGMGYLLHAMKALSPGVNDTMTAVICCDPRPRSGERMMR